jgi:glucokinase
MSYGIGIDISGTHIRTVTLTEGGDLLRREIERRDTDDPDYDWAERIDSEIARVAVGHGEPPSALGLAAPVLIASDRRRVVYLKEKIGIPFCEDGSVDLGIGKPIHLINDTHAALLGEVGCGAARGSRNVLFVGWGAEVSGAALIDGRLLRGHIGRCGQVGHTSLDPMGALDAAGMPGSLEDALGETTLAERSNGRFSTLESLFSAYGSGADAEATAFFRRSLRTLAVGLAGLINVLDPEVVVIGGPAALAGPMLLDPLNDLLEQYEWCPTGDRVRLVAGQLGPWAAACGAAQYALSRDTALAPEAMVK